ncbi:MAG: hypothetical protein JW740_00890 [Candidatus Zambryskibacteria bacterium]|nr:hypothetical protein [Candidatus Zambryskibacteria bacterium]
MFDELNLEVWDNLLLAFEYIYEFAPIWLPIFFISLAFKAWLNYKRAAYWQEESSVLLEIKLPREIHKSPAAMEVVLNSLHQTGKEGTWWDRIRKGQTRARFSLEIVSLEGKIRFFIWTQPTHRNAIETHIYSQYPEVEIYEVKEDYAKSFVYNPETISMWVAEFALTGPDPLPIKTYIDYGLDKDPKEEYKIDPMTPLLEFLGSITSGQNVWIQILIRAHKKRRILDVFKEKEDSWKNEAENEVKKILDKLKEEGGGTFPRVMTDEEKNKMTALQRSVSKYPFDCGIRAIYITEKDKFVPSNIGGTLGAVKQFGSPGSNGFKPKGWMIDFDYPWQEWFNSKDKLKAKALEEYKLRRYFYSPYLGKKYHSAKPFVLNTEELATIFHFPGEVAATPTLEKIPSLKSQAPSNLPI